MWRKYIWKNKEDKFLICFVRTNFNLFNLYFVSNTIILVCKISYVTQIEVCFGRWNLKLGLFKLKANLIAEYMRNTQRIFDILFHAALNRFIWLENRSSTYCTLHYIQPLKGIINFLYLSFSFYHYTETHIVPQHNIIQYHTYTQPIGVDNNGHLSLTSIAPNCSINAYVLLTRLRDNLEDLFFSYINEPFGLTKYSTYFVTLDKGVCVSPIEMRIHRARERKIV